MHPTSMNAIGPWTGGLAGINQYECNWTRDWWAGWYKLDSEGELLNGDPQQRYS